MPIRNHPTSSDRSRSAHDRSRDDDRDDGRHDHSRPPHREDQPGTSHRQHFGEPGSDARHRRDIRVEGPEQGYSSSSQVAGQQGRDRGYDSDDRAASERSRHGDGTTRDLDDRSRRSSRSGYVFDADIDPRESRSGEHHGFDDRGIGTPQRAPSWSVRDSTAGHDIGRDFSHRDGRWTQPSLRSPMTSSPPPARRYPAGPKGYIRSDERICEDVCERLAAMGDLDSSEVEVSVSNGEVTLTGTVPHRSMKYRAEQTCDLVNGVKDIINNVRVNDASRLWSNAPSSSFSERADKGEADQNNETITNGSHHRQ